MGVHTDYNQRFIDHLCAMSYVRIRSSTPISSICNFRFVIESFASFQNQSPHHENQENRSCSSHHGNQGNRGSTPSGHDPSGIRTNQHQVQVNNRTHNMDHKRCPISRQDDQNEMRAWMCSEGKWLLRFPPHIRSNLLPDWEKHQSFWAAKHP